MYFSLAFVLAALPFLVAAAPAEKIGVITIPLERRMPFGNETDVVSLDAIRANIAKSVA